jgi:hypothetical protein
VTAKPQTAASKVVRCSCGLEFRAPGGATDAERHLVQAVKRHAKDAHDLDFGDEQVFSMIEVVA